MRTCTRRIEFDYGHRLMRHGGKCAHVHGHRGVVEVVCTTDDLDAVGVVIDFGKVKEVVGGWVDANLDHAFIVDAEDSAMVGFLAAQRQRFYPTDGPPSAENLAELLYRESTRLLAPIGVRVSRVRFYETPNGWAEYP